MLFAFISTLAGGEGPLSWIRAERGGSFVFSTSSYFCERGNGRLALLRRAKVHDLFEFRLRLVLLAVNVATQQDGDLEGFYAIS